MYKMYDYLINVDLTLKALEVKFSLCVLPVRLENVIFVCSKIFQTRKTPVIRYLEKYCDVASHHLCLHQHEALEHTKTKAKRGIIFDACVKENNT